MTVLAEVSTPPQIRRVDKFQEFLDFPLSVGAVILAIYRYFQFLRVLIKLFLFNLQFYFFTDIFMNCEVTSTTFQYFDNLFCFLDFCKRDMSFANIEPRIGINYLSLTS